MVEQEGVPFDTLEGILDKFPPQEKIITGKNGDVAYRVSRDPNGLILYSAPETEWLKKRGEKQENQALAKN